MADDQEQPDAADTQPDAEQDTTDEPDTFDRAYVERLRKESAGYRDRVKQAEARADELARRLHTELVRATGKLQDPRDMPFSEDHLTDAEALTAAVDQLVTDRPHLRSRKPVGDVGQGTRTETTGPRDFSALFR